MYNFVRSSLLVAVFALPASATELISADPSGIVGNDRSSRPAISGDGLPSPFNRGQRTW